MGKDHSSYGAWIELKNEKGNSKYTLFNNGKITQSGILKYKLLEGETYTLHISFNIYINKILSFEVINQFGENCTYTFNDVNGYGQPFFYSETDCLVDKYMLTNQLYYDIRNAKCAVWGHSYIQADSMGEDRDKSFTNLLANSLGKDKVFNFGLGGDTFAGLIARIKNELCFAKNVKYGLVCIGANDWSRNAQYMIEKVDEIAMLLSDNKITPIFFTISPIFSEINQSFRETNTYIRENYLYVDMEQVFLNVDAVNDNPQPSDIRSDLYMGDRVHPTIEGHQLIFNRIKMDCPFLFW